MPIVGGALVTDKAPQKALDGSHAPAWELAWTLCVLCTMLRPGLRSDAEHRNDQNL